MISVTVLNLLLLLLLGVSLYFWKKFYPQKKLNLFIVLMLFSCIPLTSVWRTGSYQSGDFNDHLYFFISFYHSLAEGIWFPRWSGAFCGGYGYPHIQFFYHLPYYIASLFHFVFKLSFLDSQKLLICTSFIGAAAAMYLWLRKEWGDKAAFLGSILYILAPYNLAGAHFRNTLGESLGLVIVPMILWCISSIFDNSIKKKNWYWWGIGVLYVALILAHHVVPILCLPFVVSYFFFCGWQSKQLSWQKALLFFGVLGLSFWLTSYHWASILTEAKYIGQDHLREILFPPVTAYFFSSWRFGLLNQGPHGELTWTFGYVQWLVVVLGLLSLKVKRIPARDKNWLKFLFVWFVGLFIMLMPFTEKLWLALPLVNNFQFAIRMLFLITLLVAAIGAIVIKNFPLIFQEYLHRKMPLKYLNRAILLLVIAASLTTILNWGQRTMILDLNDERLALQIPQWCDRVAIPNWLNEQEFKNLPKRTSDIDVIVGAAKITEQKHDMEDHEYLVTATATAKLRENTTHFPGWTAYLDGKPIAITTNDPQYKGIIELEVPAGIHQLKLIYEQTPAQKLFSELSLLGVIVWGILTAFLIYTSTRKYAN